MATTTFGTQTAARYVGARVARLEDPRLLTGRGRYLDDIVLPGMVHAAFARSPHAHARLTRVDVTRARAYPGVLGAWSGEDLKSYVTPFNTKLDRPECRSSERYVLPVDKVRHVGEAVAVVVATSRYIAEDASELIDVEYEPLPVVVDAEAALEPDAPLVDNAYDDNNIAHVVMAAGNVVDAFAAADHVFKKRFHHNRYSGAPLECRGVIAEYQPGTGTLTLWTSNQMPHLTRTLLAKPLGIPESKLQVIAPQVGGGFGLKAHVFVEDAIVPTLARLLDRPVKWIEDRYEHLAASAHSKELIAYMECAMKSDGTILGLRTRLIGNAGAHACIPYTPLIDPLLAATAFTSLYDVTNIECVVDAPLTNKCQIGAYRGVGWTPGQTAREVFLDDIARALKLDPVEMRLRNCIPADPGYRTALGQTYDGGSYAEAIHVARQMVDYEAFRTKQGELREHGRYIGIGFSPYVEPTAFGTAGSAAAGQPVAYFDSASVAIEPDGSVIVTTGLHSHGQGHETSLAQVTADALGARIEDIRYVQGDTTAAAYGFGTYASRSAVIGTGSIMRAASDVRDKLIRAAAHMLEAAAEDIVLVRGTASVKGAPARTLTLAEIADFVYFGGEARPGDLEPTLTATRHYDPPETYSNGCVVVCVEVDTGTGLVDIQRIVAVEDCGNMLNPLIVEGQVAGAIAQGIGGALYEDLVYDEANGEFLSGSLMDYLYPSTCEVPAMEMGHIETPSPVTDGGVKGMGEAGSIATPAAIANAVADALAPFGADVTRLPLTPDYVLQLSRELE